MWGILMMKLKAVNDCLHTKHKVLWGFALKSKMAISCLLVILMPGLVGIASAANLVGHWKFDETSGATTVDSSGYGNNGTKTGALRVFGYINYALDFSGWEQYVTIPSPSSIPVGSGAFTISAWIYPDVHNGGQITFWGTTAGNQANGFRLGYGGVMTHYFWGNDYEVVTGDLSGKWSHVALVHDGAGIRRFYLNGHEIVGRYVGTLQKQVPNVASTDVFIGKMQNSSYWDGKLDDVRIYDGALSQAEIRSTAGFNDSWASSPSDKAKSVPPGAVLQWSSGSSATSHDVYFGTSEDVVKTANHSSAEYQGNQETNSYDPAVDFELGTEYYWRIDEVDASNNTYKGNVWSFTAAWYSGVEDFDSYADNAALTADWSGLGSAAVTLETNPAFVFGDSGNSMRIDYDNSSSPYYSEAVRTYTGNQDWTADNVEYLTFWYKGNTGNAAEEIYIELEDASLNSAVQVAAGVNLLQLEWWRELSFKLSDFGGVDLTQIRKVTIGIGQQTPQAGGSGTVYIDDIRLHKPKDYGLNADFNRDGTVDITDLSTIASAWLDGPGEADIFEDNQVDLKDFSILANEWQNRRKVVWFDGANLSYDDQRIAEVVQGIVNRQSPRMFLYMPTEQAWNMPWSPDTWPNIYATDYNLEFEEMSSESVVDLVKRFSDEFKGLIVYYPDIDG